MKSNSNLALRLAAPAGSSAPAQSLETVLEALVVSARELLDTDGVSLFLFRDGVLSCRASAGVGPPVGSAQDAASGLMAKCLRSRDVQTCPDIALEEGNDRETYLALGIRSLLVVPVLRSDREVAGILGAMRVQPGGFDEESLHCLKIVAHAIESAIQEPMESNSATAFPSAARAESPAGEAFACGASPTMAIDADKAASIACPVTPPAAVMSQEVSETAGDIQELPAIASMAGRQDTTKDTRHQLPELPSSFASSQSQLPEARTSSSRYTVPLYLVPLVAAVFLIVGGLIGYQFKARGPETHASSVPPAPAMAQEHPEEPSPQLRATSTLQPAPSATDAPATLTELQHHSTPESSTVVIALDGPVTYRVHRLPEPERVYIDLNHARLPRGMNGTSFAPGGSCLQKYRIGAREAMTARVTFETGELCDYSITLAPGGSSLTVSLTPHQRGR